MIKNKTDLQEYIIQDAETYGVKNVKSLCFIIMMLLTPIVTLKYQILMRRIEFYENTKRKGLIWLFTKWRFRRLSMKLGFSISPHTFGPGLCIPHYGTIVVNPNVRIGHHCRIHVGTNIGASGGEDKVPVIGNNVYIGPGSIVFGDIIIADNVTIGANSTVTKSFTTPNVTIAGSPAKVIKENSLAWNDTNVNEL